MTTAVLTPYRREQATRAGRNLYRKQVLPVGSIDYKGRRLDFTRDYLADLARAFNDGAYEQVPFLLAPGDNAHTMDPERMRGEVRALELADDGLYALVDLTDDGARVVEANPRLGVSARIVEGLARADGKTFPRAIQHVLGTLDPRVTGMKPWESVDLANDGTAVVDLTSATYTQEGATMPEITEAQQALLDRLAALPADQLDQLLTPPASTEPGTETGSENDEATEQAIAEALAALAAEGAEGKEPVGAGAELSAEAQQAIDLATAQAEQSRTEVRAMQTALAKERFKTERAELLAAGVPPKWLDLAAPLLELPEAAVIDLANDQKVDATAIVRQLLAAAKGTIDLSAESGSAVAGPDDVDEKDRQAALEAWERQFPAKR